MSVWTLYWLTRLDSLNCWLTVICGAFAILTIVFLIGAATASDFGSDEDVTRRLGVAKKLGAVLALTSFMLVFVPSTKDVFMIIGGAYLTQNEDIQKLPPMAAKAVSQFLENYVDKEKSDNEAKAKEKKAKD